MVEAWGNGLSFILINCNDQIYVYSSLFKNMNGERQPKKKVSTDSVEENIKCKHVCPETRGLYILIT